MKILSESQIVLAGGGENRGAAGSGRVRTLARSQTLRHLASRFCEMFYVYGLGHSGKDVLFLILTAFLGTLPFQYSAMLPGTYLTAMGRREQASPFLSRLEGKRLVWASEVPPHDNLNVDFIKPFCEQTGAPICSRALHRSPKDFRPSALLVH